MFYEFTFWVLCFIINQIISGVLIIKTHFHIKNKEFADYLKLTTNGEIYYFCDDITVELDDC